MRFYKKVPFGEVSHLVKSVYIPPGTLNTVEYYVVKGPKIELRLITEIKAKYSTKGGNHCTFFDK